MSSFMSLWTCSMVNALSNSLISSRWTFANVCNMHFAEVIIQISSVNFRWFYLHWTISRCAIHIKGTHGPFIHQRNVIPFFDCYRISFRKRSHRFAIIKLVNFKIICAIFIASCVNSLAISLAKIYFIKKKIKLQISNLKISINLSK
jgi:hypothetical protein